MADKTLTRTKSSGSQDTDSAGVSSTRTKSNGLTGYIGREGKGGAGEGRWKSKKLCSTCEQGCCGRSILAVASKDKHLGLKLCLDPRLVRYACYIRECMLPTDMRKHADTHTFSFDSVGKAENESLSKPYGQCCRSTEF